MNADREDVLHLEVRCGWKWGANSKKAVCPVLEKQSELHPQSNTGPQGSEGPRGRDEQVNPNPKRTAWPHSETGYSLSN